jgi:hypothetical protein
MPERKTMERAEKDKREGKAASTQAGEFVREEMHHVREGKHGARSSKQAIAIGLSKARRSGVKVGAPKKGKTSAATRKKAKRDTEKGQSKKPATTSRKRSQATTRALKREGRSAASRSSLSKQGRQAARKRTHAERSAAAKKGARTRARNKAERGES